MYNKYHTFQDIAEPYDKCFDKYNIVTVCHLYLHTNSSYIEFGALVVYCYKVQVFLV